MKSAKISFLIAFITLVILISSYSVSAHFVCGQVLNSVDNVSSSWLPVRVYYPSSPENYTTCEVSPQGNKYCCDTEAQKSSGVYSMGKAWTPGLIADAQIYSPSTGYVAGPVSVTTTTQGYDVFPTMQIEKVIKVISPNVSLIISNSTSVLLNVSLVTPYDDVSITNGSYSLPLCPNCTSFSGYVNGSYGMNHWNLSARDGNKVFSQEINLAILENASVKREFKCKGCSGSVIPPDKEVSVNLTFNLSNYVGGISLEEYVPSEFIIGNTTGTVRSYNSTYNVITWNSSGQVINEDYTLFSPHVVWPFSYSYNFESSVGDIPVNSDTVSIKGPFSILPTKGPEHSHGGYYGKEYPHISPQNPYVLEGNQSIQKLAFFPQSGINGAQFGLVPGGNCNSVDGVIGCYSVSSNVGSKDINSTYIEFKVNKDGSTNPKDISLLSYSNGWKKQNITLTGEDKNNLYFKGSFTGSSIAIVNDNYKGLKIPSLLGSGRQLPLKSLFNMNPIDIMKIQGEIFNLFVS